MTITTKVYHSIDEVEPVVWDGLLGLRSLTFSHAFWRVIELSHLNDFEYRYVIFFDADNQPIGLTTCYVVTTDIAIFAPLWLRTVLIKARRFYGNFLKLKMLECGTPIILNSPPFVIHPDVEMDDLIEPLHKTLKQQARKDGVLLMVLRDFESPDWGLFEPLKELGYHEVMGLPNTYLDIRWPSIEAYRADLKSYYRSKVNNHLRKNAELDVHFDLIDDFAHLADD